MILATTDAIPGKRIARYIGLVRGSSVRAAHIGKDIMSSLKNLLGGELEHYTKLMAESREQAIDRLTENAEFLGANAVIGLRFSTSSVTTKAAEILAYGTAVWIEDDAAND